MVLVILVLGILMAVVNRIAENRGKPRAELRGCEACPMAATCKLNSKENCEENSSSVEESKEAVI